jgi:predicted nucleic acid-binding protein
VAGDLGLYAYDAYVLTAAHERRVPLVTLDRRLMAAAAELGVGVVGIER